MSRPVSYTNEIELHEIITIGLLRHNAKINSKSINFMGL